MQRRRIDSLLRATDGRRVWLRVGTLLNGTGSTPLRNAHLVFDKNQILFAGENWPAADLLNPNRSEPDLDLPEWTVLPGLIEAHAHLFLAGGETNLTQRAAHLRKSSAELLQLARTRLGKLARMGIIAVRDAGDRDGVGLALSRLYASANRPPMPCVDSPGPAIHRRGRYGSFMAEPIEKFASLKDCVEARVKAGADRIKLIATGTINFEKGAMTVGPQLTAGEISEIVRVAKSFGKQTFAHASGDAGIENAVVGGVDSVEHGFFVRDDQLAKMRDRQIAWVPTFAPVQAQVVHADVMGWNVEVIGNLQKILDQHAASLVKGHQMGVPIVAGSDAGSLGVAHGPGLLNELELMERAGLSPIAVINSATGASSNRLAFREKFGHLKPGHLSRFMLTRHSPLESVSNLRKQKFVAFDGAVFDSGESFDPGGL